MYGPFGFWRHVSRQKTWPKGSCEPHRGGTVMVDSSTIGTESQCRMRVAHQYLLIHHLRLKEGLHNSDPRMVESVMQTFPEAAKFFR